MTDAADASTKSWFLPTVRNNAVAMLPGFDASEVAALGENLLSYVVISYLRSIAPGAVGGAD